MPCPHAGRASSSRISRRDFLRVAVAIGGTSALSACLASEGLPELPRGAPDAVPDRQHAWGEYMLDDEHGNPKFPEYQSFIFLDYQAEGVPTEGERERVETAFRTVERAHVWGAGEGAHEKFFHDGVFFTIAYSPGYFARFDESLPDSVDLKSPGEIHRAIDEDPEKADDYDAVLHLGSDYPQVLLALELALFGELDELNGVEMDAHLGDVFEKRERRAGFVGRGLPREHLDDERIPEDAIVSMGFKSALLDNLPPEDSVTLQEGPFAGGTIQHISRLAIDLESWYALESDERVTLMFSPDHSVEQVGETGEFLASDSETSEETVHRTLEDARERGLVGHTQKVARARNEAFEPRILRRGDFNSADPAGSALHFGAIQRTTDDLITTLQAMYDVNFDADGSDEVELDRERNGILSFLETESRANFLMPPRERRALPTPNG